MSDKNLVSIILALATYQGETYLRESLVSQTYKPIEIHRLIDDLLKRVEKKHVDYFSPTQNALVARANIDLLIPLINVKGGVAVYDGKLEGLPIEKHVNVTKLRQKAIDNVKEEENNTRISGFIMIIGVLILVTLILFLFN